MDLHCAFDGIANIQSRHLIHIFSLNKCQKILVSGFHKLEYDDSCLLNVWSCTHATTLLAFCNSIP